MDRRLCKQTALDRRQTLVGKFGQARAIGLGPLGCSSHQLTRVREKHGARAKTNLQHLVWKEYTALRIDNAGQRREWIAILGLQRSVGGKRVLQLLFLPSFYSEE